MYVATHNIYLNVCTLYFKYETTALRGEYGKHQYLQTKVETRRSRPSTLTRGDTICMNTGVMHPAKGSTKIKIIF